MYLSPDSTPISFDDIGIGIAFEHDGRLFIKIDQPGSAVALDNGAVAAFTGANMVHARPDAIAVGIPSPLFHL